MTLFSSLPHQLVVSEPTLAPAGAHDALLRLIGLCAQSSATLNAPITRWPVFAGLERACLHCDAILLCRIKIMKLLKKGVAILL